MFNSEHEQLEWQRQVIREEMEEREEDGIKEKV